MLAATLTILSIASVAGAGLAFWHMRADPVRPSPPYWMGIAHGICGIIGIAGLAAVVQGPARGIASGTGSFGWASLIVLVLAAVLGGLIPFLARGRGRVSPTLIGIHATVAVTGYVIFLAWASFA